MSEDQKPEILIELKNVDLCLKNALSLFGRGSKNEKQILFDISLDVFKGESLGVIGRNGMGKSTLLRVMSGVYAPDRGEALRSHRVKIALLTGEAGFVNFLSGRENAILGGMLLGLTRKEVGDALPNILELSGLGSKVDDLYGSYSAGMKARLKFATAVHVGSDVLLIDEVLSVGDQEFREVSAKIMHELVSSDRTVVLVSHNLEFVEETCDRVMWLEQGRVIAVGPTKSIIRQYRYTVKNGEYPPGLKASLDERNKAS